MNEINTDNNAPQQSESASIEVRIEKLLNGGDGLARHEGQAIFVPLTAPGDRVRARVIARRSGFWQATLEEILEPVTVDMRRLKPNHERPCGSGAAHCITRDESPADENEPLWRQELEHLLTRIWKEGGARQGGGLLRQLRERADFELAELALGETGGNRKRAAELLGVSTATISRRLSSGKS